MDDVGDRRIGNRLGQSSFSSYGTIPQSRYQPMMEGASSHPPSHDETESAYSAQTAYTKHFQQVVGKVTSNVQDINSSSSKLEHALGKIGSSDDTSEFRERLHQVQQRTNDVIKETMEQLKELILLTRKGQIKQDQLRVERIRNQYKECVQHYGSVQKNVLKITIDTDASKPAPVPGLGATQTLIDITDQEGGEQDVSLLDTERLREQQQIQHDNRQAQLEIDMALFQEREDHVLALESDILDINTIMRDVGNIIHEHGETVDSIADNIDSAFTQVESGNVQLRKASAYQRSSRKNLCILVVILVSVVIVIVIIIGASINK